ATGSPASGEPPQRPSAQTGHAPPRSWRTASTRSGCVSVRLSPMSATGVDCRRTNSAAPATAPRPARSGADRAPRITRDARSSQAPPTRRWYPLSGPSCQSWSCAGLGWRQIARNAGRSRTLDGTLRDDDEVRTAREDVVGVRSLMAGDKEVIARVSGADL